MSLSNGEQKIFIWVDFKGDNAITISHGSLVASILNKEICLFYHHPATKSITSSQESTLNNWKGSLQKQVGSHKVHTFVSGLPLETILTEMAEEYDALLLVASKIHSRELLPKLPHSGFPFLFVAEKEQIGKCYQNISVPVSYMKKSKDLALWSSYFARHNGAKITLVKAKAKFAEDNRLILSILNSIERLFKNFNFPYTIAETTIPTWKIQKQALAEALKSEFGLLIISFTHQSSFIDRLLKINDTAVIDLSESLSVMCINSQRDLYTFCG